MILYIKTAFELGHQVGERLEDRSVCLRWEATARSKYALRVWAQARGDDERHFKQLKWSNKSSHVTKRYTPLVDVAGSDVCELFAMKHKHRFRR